MIKEALQYIVGLSEPNTLSIDGELFADKNMQRIRPHIQSDSIELSTLSSLIDYLRENDEVFCESKLIVHVESPTRVKVFAQRSCTYDLQNKLYLQVTAGVPSFHFGKWYYNEEFVISVMSKFKNSSMEELSNGIRNDKPEVLQFAGTVQDGTVANYGDTGVSQSATIKTGILNTEEKLIPNPVELIPFRTFNEVDQPASQFVFRMRSTSDGVQCALFEADGGAWQNEAMQNIKAYLTQELSKIEHSGLEFIVIA